jgi:hypothetical protein
MKADLLQAAGAGWLAMRVARLKAMPEAAGWADDHPAE